MDKASLAAPLIARLANSGLTNKELLYIADAVFRAEAPDLDSAECAFKRHGEQNMAIAKACHTRGINVENGTVTTVSTIDLLA